VDIRQIADKFPDKRGGLKEMYDKGPQSAFFLVKFWVTMLLALLPASVVTGPPNGPVLLWLLASVFCWRRL